MQDQTDLATLGAIEPPDGEGHRDGWVEETAGLDRVISVHTREELEQITVSAKEDIERLETSYDVESPTELRELATKPDTSSADAREYFRKASEWDRHRHMLQIAREAFERYDEFVEGHGHHSADSVA